MVLMFVTLLMTFVLGGGLFASAQVQGDWKSIADCANETIPASKAACEASFTAKTTSSSTCDSITNPASKKACEDSIKTLVDKYKIPQQTAEALTTFIVILSIILKTLYSLLIPIAGMIGKFMSGDWVSGGIFNVDILIETLWQVIRNMVNIVIILYLVYVAGRNIVPFGDNGQYDIKRVLPKVALALVVVNFSFFFCRTVLSIANVTTTMAFSMPNTIGANVYGAVNGGGSRAEGTTPYIWYEPIGPDLDGKLTLSSEEKAAAESQKLFVMECLHRNYAFNFKDGTTNNEPTLIANPKIDSNKKEYVRDGQNFYKRILISNVGSTTGSPTEAEYVKKTKEVIAQRSTKTDYPYYNDCIHTFEEMSFSSRNAMYVYAFNLLRIPSYEKSFSNIEGFADASTRLFISAFFLVMFFGISVAMLIAMAARTFFLWFMMMLSPIWVLTDVLKIWRGEDVDKEGVLGGYGKFLALAFLPTIMGVVLSVGFMMVHLINLFATRDGTANGRINMGSISLWFDPAQPVGGVGDLFATMMGIFALMALWVAVFAAFKFGFKSIRLASSVMDKFESGAKRIGGFVAKTPLDAQILPFGQGGARVSASTLMQVPRRMMDNVEQRRQVMTEEGLRAMGLNADTQLSASGRMTIQNTLKSSTSDGAKTIATLQEHAQSYEGRGVRDQALRYVLNDNGDIKSDAEVRKLGNPTFRKGNGEYTITQQQLLGLRDHLDGLDSTRKANLKSLYSQALDPLSKGQYTDGRYLNLHNNMSSFTAPSTAKKYTVSQSTGDVTIGNATNKHYMGNSSKYETDVRIEKAKASQTKVVPQSILNDMQSFVNDAKRAGVSGTEVATALRESLRVHKLDEILQWEIAPGKEKLEAFLNKL